MINKNKNSAFTLIELIVVITILVILATIAVISLQGRTQEAKNSKITSDINSIGKSINIKIIDGVSLLSIIDNSIINRKVTSGAISGTGYIENTDYKGGVLNYQILGIKKEDFIDPSSSYDYSIGGTLKSGGNKYEVAGKIIEEGIPKAYVGGNGYVKRVQKFIEIIPNTTVSNTVTINNLGDEGYFKNSDIVYLSGSNIVASIKAISKDLKTITLENPPGSSTHMILGNDADPSTNVEVDALTGDSAKSNIAVVNGGKTYLPY